MNSNDEQSYTADEILGNINKEILIVSKFKTKKELKACTYDNGYKTQEVFSCLTCYKETNKMAAICGGCAFTCHEDHDIEELGFKRSIKCDCGNSKFGKPIV
jgi:hypothetical protein